MSRQVIYNAYSMSVLYPGVLIQYIMFQCLHIRLSCVNRRKRYVNDHRSGLKRIHARVDLLLVPNFLLVILHVLFSFLAISRLEDVSLFCSLNLVLRSWTGLVPIMMIRTSFSLTEFHFCSFHCHAKFFLLSTFSSLLVWIRSEHTKRMIRRLVSNKWVM